MPAVASTSLDSRSKRSAKTLSEMVAAADAVSTPAGPFYRPGPACTDTSLHSSSKRTRTSTPTDLLADSSVADGTTSTHTGNTVGLTGTFEQIHVSEPGGSTHGGRSRRARVCAFSPAAFCACDNSFAAWLSVCDEH